MHMGGVRAMLSPTANTILTATVSMLAFTKAAVVNFEKEMM